MIPYKDQFATYSGLFDPYKTATEKLQVSLRVGSEEHHKLKSRIPEHGFLQKALAMFVRAVVSDIESDPTENLTYSPENLRRIYGYIRQRCAPAGSPGQAPLLDVPNGADHLPSAPTRRSSKQRTARKGGRTKKAHTKNKK